MHRAAHLECKYTLCGLAGQQAALRTNADQHGGPLPALRLAQQAVQLDAGLQLLLLLLADACAWETSVRCGMNSVEHQLPDAPC